MWGDFQSSISEIKTEVEGLGQSVQEVELVTEILGGEQVGLKARITFL